MWLLKILGKFITVWLLSVPQKVHMLKDFSPYGESIHWEVIE